MTQDNNSSPLIHPFFFDIDEMFVSIVLQARLANNLHRIDTYFIGNKGEIMADFIEAKVKTRIRCPIDVVRKQFSDFDHHIRHQVHRGVHFSILDKSNGKVRLRVESKLAGLPQKDEWLVYTTSEGHLMHEFITGMNKGGGIEVQFNPDGSDATIVEARAFLPNKGIKRLFAPVFRKALQKIGERSFEEDRVDLENGNYKVSEK
jgi:hypothetical protein